MCLDTPGRLAVRVGVFLTVTVGSFAIATPAQPPVVNIKQAEQMFSGDVSRISTVHIKAPESLFFLAAGKWGRDQRRNIV